MLTKCLGECGKTIGSSCGCCSPDFPEEYGYCENCFKKSEPYVEETQPINNLIDRLDAGGILALELFVKSYREDFNHIYKEIINNSKIKDNQNK